MRRQKMMDAASRPPVPVAPTGTPTSRTWSRDKFTSYYLALTVIAMVLFTLCVVRNFTRPIIGLGDATTHAYQSYYVATHLYWKPYPQLQLHDDRMFYPYGVDQVFQPWVFERDLFGALCYHLIGLGPWLQIHYMFSVWVVAVAGYFLLRTAHSPGRAALTAFFLAFGNYYGINKYPGHANLTVIHWTILGAVVDYLISRRFYLGEGISARMVALRVVLVLLTIGQDLGYNAGLGLTSFVVTATWIVLLAVLRTRGVRELASRRGGNPPKDWLELRLRVRPRGLWALLDGAAWQAAFARPLGTGVWLGRLQWLALFVVGSGALFLYFPLVLQIFLHARHFPVGDMQLPGSGSADSPWRILLPILPATTTGAFWQGLATRLGDTPEAWFSSQPGLALVCFALLGLGFALRRRQFGAFVPTLVCLLLVLFYNPTRPWSTLKIFPWASFARVAGHYGSFYTPVVALLTLGIPDSWLKPRFRGAGNTWTWAVTLPLSILLLTEGVSAYRVILSQYRPDDPPDRNFYHTMKTVRRSPGSAVLDWPFCVAGGNGFATGELGPYYNLQCNIYCLNEFDYKKTVSAYFGRLHPHQYKPLYDAGWPAMFTSDAPEGFILDGRHQRRDFQPYEWRFFEDFFKLNDFCGILLYTDILPPETVAGMHARFGEPVEVTRYSAAGRVEFIRRPAAWAGLVDEKKGRALKLGAPDYTPGQRLDCTRNEALPFLRSGWSSCPPGAPRFSEGHQAEVLFYLKEASPLELRLETSSFGSQAIAISMNGTPLQGPSRIDPPSREYRFAVPAKALRPGDNRLVIDLPDAHSPLSIGESIDPRVLGLLINWLELVPAEGVAGGPAAP